MVIFPTSPSLHRPCHPCEIPSQAPISSGAINTPSPQILTQSPMFNLTMEPGPPSSATVERALSFISPQYEDSQDAAAAEAKADPAVQNDATTGVAVSVPGSSGGAPQIYFVGENIFNLKEELLRASKIKCNHCGLKGAALGCYMKSCRRSFHVPCAYGISDCRWDCENYLVLCPTHSANKLPCDKLKKNKKIKANDSVGSVDPSQVRISPTPQQCDDPMTSSSWIFCGSALSKEEKALLDKFAILIGAEVTSSWKENVTHVIAGTDEHGACSRTLKFLMAILSGKWILSLDWIKDCMEVGLPVSEEPYEICRDVHGSFDGPKNGRIRAMEKAPKLFSGLSFYFYGYFDPCHKGRIEELVTTAGGALKLQKSKNCKEMTPTMFVVYCADPPEGCDPGKLGEVIAERRKNAEALAARTGSRAIAHTWLLDAIAGCKLQLEE